MINIFSRRNKEPVRSEHRQPHGSHGVRGFRARPRPREQHATLVLRAAMSPRNFARIFLAETGMTPAKFVERARLEAIRCKLEQSSLRIEAIAEQFGFRNAERMLRAFHRILGVGPQDYRARFKSTVLN